MARLTLGPIIAPVFIGACVAVTTHPVHDATQAVRDVPAARDPRPEPPAVVELSGSEIVDPELAALPEDTTPAAVPIHEVEDSLPVPVRSFARTTDRARIEARGELRVDALVDAAALRAAASVDNRTWASDQRRELLAFLRGGAVDRNARFTEADARTIAKLQSGSGAVADGMLDDETMAILLALNFRFSARVPGAVRLEFYPGELEDLDAWNLEIQEKVTRKGGGFQDVDGPPGEGTIYVRVGGSIVAGYRARGGPPSPLKDGKHVALPTTPGTYRLGEPHRHVTSNWHYSQIPWGAEIRAIDGGYQYRSSAQAKWSWGTVHPSGTLKEPFDHYEFADLPEVTRAGVTYFIWNKNDFGPIAWNLVPSDQYVHTTPHTEALAAEAEPGPITPLGFSHGCIHIDPRERDEMMKRGYLGKDIPFTVRTWTEHRLPHEIRRELIAPPLITSSPKPPSACEAATTEADASCAPEGR